MAADKYYKRVIKGLNSCLFDLAGAFMRTHTSLSRCDEDRKDGEKREKRSPPGLASVGDSQWKLQISLLFLFLPFSPPCSLASSLLNGIITDIYSNFPL